MGKQNSFIGYVVAMTEKAILFWDHYWEDPIWLPKSQITVFFEQDTNEVRVSASSWICQQSGIREFTYRKKEI